MIVKNAESMSAEEKKKYIDEQVKSLQDRFQIIPSGGGGGGATSSQCEHCDHGPARMPATHGPPLGSVMTQEEQSNFFKALYNAKR